MSQKWVIMHFINLKKFRNNAKSKTIQNALKTVTKEMKNNFGDSCQKLSIIGFYSSFSSQLFCRFGKKYSSQNWFFRWFLTLQNRWLHWFSYQKKLTNDFQSVFWTPEFLYNWCYIDVDLFSKQMVMKNAKNQDFL